MDWYGLLWKLYEINQRCPSNPVYSIAWDTTKIWSTQISRSKVVIGHVLGVQLLWIRLIAHIVQVCFLLSHGHWLYRLLDCMMGCPNELIDICSQMKLPNKLVYLCCFYQNFTYLIVSGIQNNSHWDWKFQDATAMHRNYLCEHEAGIVDTCATFSPVCHSNINMCILIPIVSIRLS